VLRMTEKVRAPHYREQQVPRVVSNTYEDENSPRDKENILEIPRGTYGETSGKSIN